MKVWIVQFLDTLPKNDAFLSLKTVFILAYSADPDEILICAVFHLGLHCLPKYWSVHQYPEKKLLLYSWLSFIIELNFRSQPIRIHTFFSVGLYCESMLTLYRAEIPKWVL